MINLSLLRIGVLIAKLGFLVNVILFFGFFSTYFVFVFHILRHVIPSADDLLKVQALLNFVIAITLLLSSFFIHKINKLHFIYTSSILIMAMTFLLLFVPNELIKLTIIFVIGIFFGIGLLVFFTYFWNLTVPEERGRIAGLIGFVALPLEFVVDYLVAPSLDFFGTIILSIVISSGILLVVLLRPQKAVLTAKKNERGNFFEKRTVLLYSIPWILFSVINVILAKNISINILQQVSSSFYMSLMGLQIIGVVFGAMVGGIVADFFGLRLSLALSLTLYGTSAALGGIFINNEILYFVYIANGLGWGILFVLYMFVVWGDLANKDNCAKMYSIGLIIYFSTVGIGLLTQISIPIVASSLISCLLVFFSNIPIALAPELLPSDFRERIKLRLHVNAVKRISKRNHG